MTSHQENQTMPGFSEGLADNDCLVAIQEAAQGIPPATLTPVAFFVAWNGVITLGFEGFPPPLVTLKLRLEASRERLGLPLEGFGSKWPKTTLAAMHDDATPMGLKEFEALRDICREHTARLAGAPRIPAATVSLVDYEQRSLEQVIHRTDVSLAAAVPKDGVGQVSAEERHRVAGVLAEWDDSEAYLPRVNAPGSRASSYRERSPHGSTSVIFWDERAIHLFQHQLSELREAVDAILPGHFQWADRHSLHCTLRALS